MFSAFTKAMIMILVFSRVTDCVTFWKLCRMKTVIDLYMFILLSLFSQWLRVWLGMPITYKVTGEFGRKQWNSYFLTFESVNVIVSRLRTCSFLMQLQWKMWYKIFIIISCGQHIYLYCCRAIGDTLLVGLLMI